MRDLFAVANPLVNVCFIHFSVLGFEQITKASMFYDPTVNWENC